MNRTVQGREIGFWETLFRHYHTEQRSQPERNHRQMTLPIALMTLRDFSGMTREQLSARLGIMPHTLKLLEERNGYFSQDHCLACERIAASFDLQELAMFFDLAAVQAGRIVRRGHRSTKDRDSITQGE